MDSNTVIFNYLINSNSDISCVHKTSMDIFEKTVTSNVVMNNMPLRISFGVNEVIHIYCDELDSTTNITSALPSIDMMINATIPRTAMASQGTINDQIEVFFSATVDQIAEAYPENNIISISDNLSGVLERIFLQGISNEHIDFDSSLMSLSSEINLKTDFFVSIDAKIYAIAMSTSSLENDVISIVAKNADTLAGYYRTINETSQYTINQIKDLTLKELYFTEVG